MAPVDDSSSMWPQSPPDAPPVMATSPLLPDIDLVLGAARVGESWAFERLFEVFSGPLRRFAVARGAQDPDGLANDVMVEVFGALPRFKGGESALRGFMFHVARKRLIDDYRKRGRRPVESSGLEGRDPATTADPIDEMLGLERALTLLETITDNQRDVLVLRVLCDLSIAEVAAALGKPATAVKALQRRGIASLRQNILATRVS